MSHFESCDGRILRKYEFSFDFQSHNFKTPLRAIGQRGAHTPFGLFERL